MDEAAGRSAGELAEAIQANARAIVNSGDLGVMAAAADSIGRLAALLPVVTPEDAAQRAKAAGHTLAERHIARALDIELIVRAYLIDKERGGPPTKAWAARWTEEHPDREPLSDRSLRAWVRRFRKGGADALLPRYGGERAVPSIPQAARSTFIEALQQGARIADAWHLVKTAHPDLLLPALSAFRRYARRVHPRAA